MTDKKIVERAKSVFHTSLHMLRDMDVIDQPAVKRLSNMLEEEIKLTKNREDFLEECEEVLNSNNSSDDEKEYARLYTGVKGEK